MSKEQKNVPKLRFPEFDNDWNKKRFGQFVLRQSTSVVSDAENPCVEYEDIISGQGILNKNVYEKEVFKSGIQFTSEDVLYGKLRPYLHNWLNPLFNGVAVGDWWVLKPVGVDKNFLFRLIQTPRFDEVANQSSGTKMPRADWKLVSNTEFMIPLLIEEQVEIAKIFDNIDTLITLHQRKLDAMKEYKKGMLQKMFPKEGESVPEVRFPGFDGEWERRSFFSCISKITDFRGRTPKKLGLEWSDNGYLALSALNVKDGFIDFSQDIHYGDQELYDKWMGGNELHKGQVLFTTEAPMGNVAQVPDNKGYILSQRTIAFDVVSDIISEDFLAVLLRTPLVFSSLTTLSSGGTAKGVSQKSLASLNIFVPHSLEEQELLSTMFGNLDNLISLQQRKIDEMKEYKKGLLQQMFV